MHRLFAGKIVWLYLAIVILILSLFAFVLVGPI